MHAVVVVDVDPLDRRQLAPEHAIEEIPVERRAEDHLPAALEGHAAHHRALLARRVVEGAGRRSRRGALLCRPVPHPFVRLDPLQASVQRQQVLRRAGRRASEHLPHRGVLSADLLPLPVAQRVDVQQQRLLDLGVVEQVAPALGGELGVVGQHDGRAVLHTPFLTGGGRRRAAPRAARLRVRVT